MKLLKGHKGLSLVEVTIMLLVLMILTGVLAPSIFDFVKDAQWVKVKEDCEAIAVSVSRLVRDVNPCLHKQYAGFINCQKTNRLDIMYSDGVFPSTDGTTFYTGGVSPAAVTNNWLSTGNSPTAQMDSMENQFVKNTPGYPAVGASSAVPWYPAFHTGWRGPYLSAPIGPDPWGAAYEVNTVFLTVAADAGNQNGQGGALQSGGSGIWLNPVFCISAGPDNIIMTKFGSDPGNVGVTRKGDDFITVIQGTSR